MKIALPSQNDVVDSHFGHCEFFTVYSVDENKELTNKEVLPSASGCGCKSDIAQVLAEKGVRVMLAGNMGMGAVNVLESQGIEVVRGCYGKVEDVALAWLHGELNDSGVGCAQHDQGCGLH